MKQKLFIINVEPWSYELNRLVEEAEHRDLEVISVFIKDIRIVVENGIDKLYLDNEHLDLQNSYAILRNVYHTPRMGALNILDQNVYVRLCMLLLEQGCKVPNAKCVLKNTNLEDKYVQTSLLAAAGFPVIEPTCVSNGMHLSEVPMPCIVKPRIGSGGRGVMKIESTSQLRLFLQREIEGAHILQPFIQNDHDLRVWITRDKVWGAIKRMRSSGDINNISAGGQAESFDIGQSVVDTDMLFRLIDYLDADYLGVDLIYDSDANKYSILEINRYCQFKGFESATNQNMAKNILDLALTM